MRNVFLWVAANAAILALVGVAYHFWPSIFEDEESPYVCKSLDNGLDHPYTPVEVCISRDDIFVTDGCRLEDDAGTHALVPPSALPPLLLVYDPSYDTYCVLERPTEPE